MRSYRREQVDGRRQLFERQMKELRFVGSVVSEEGERLRRSPFPRIYEPDGLAVSPGLGENGEKVVVVSTLLQGWDCYKNKS